MFGAGRPAKRPSILGVRVLVASDLEGLKRGKVEPVKSFRESHHRIARLFAMGLRTGEVAEESGYSLVRISTLHASPAFQDLIQSYRKSVDQEWRKEVQGYYGAIVKTRDIAARMILDKVESAEDGEEIPLKTLVTLHADLADRTGYPKRTVALNINMDFAAQLDRAVERSRKARLGNPLVTIEHEGRREPAETESHAGPAPLRIERRL